MTASTRGDGRQGPSRPYNETWALSVTSLIIASATLAYLLRHNYQAISGFNAASIPSAMTIGAKAFWVIFIALQLSTIELEVFATIPVEKVAFGGISFVLALALEGTQSVRMLILIVVTDNKSKRILRLLDLGLILIGIIDIICLCIPCTQTVAFYAAKWYCSLIVLLVVIADYVTLRRAREVKHDIVKLLAEGQPPISSVDADPARRRGTVFRRLFTMETKGSLPWIEQLHQRFLVFFTCNIFLGFWMLTSAVISIIPSLNFRLPKWQTLLITVQFAIISFSRMLVVQLVRSRFATIAKSVGEVKTISSTILTDIEKAQVLSPTSGPSIGDDVRGQSRLQQ